MFSGNLNRYPPFFQLAVFLGLWTILKMISFSFINVLMQRWYDGNIMDQLLQQDLNAENISALLVFNGVDSICSFILPPILFASLIKKNPLNYLDVNRPQSFQYIYVVLTAIGLLAFVPALGSFINQLNLGGLAQENLEQLRTRNGLIFEDKSVEAFWRNLLLLAVIPAIGEELFFRGIIQKFAMNWSRKPLYAIIFTSIFFTLIHFQINNFIPIFIAGLILGLVYYWTANLSMTILIHFLYNGIQVFLNWKTPDMDESLMMRIGLLILGAVILSILLYFMSKKIAKHPDNWKVQLVEISEENKELN